jgi:hypothetical protein
MIANQPEAVDDVDKSHEAGKGHRYSSVGIPGTGIPQRTYGKAGDDESAAIWAAQQLARMETTTLTRRLVPKTLSASFMELG